MACKYKYKDNWYSEEEVLNLLRKENSSFTTLYNNLIKELETSETGRKVFESVKKNYPIVNDISIRENIWNYLQKYALIPVKEIKFFSLTEYNTYRVNVIREDGSSFDHVISVTDIGINFTAEQQQEEAIVTLLGMMAADKLDVKKDSTLISKLKELWKQISDFVKSLLTGNISENEVNTIIENEVTYTDEEGNPCAKDGMRRSKFTKGSQWEIVKDLKGYPSHAQGGVDIKLGKDGFSFTGKDGEIKAANGLVLPKIK